MRVQVITALRRLGGAAGFGVDCLNTDVAVKWKNGDLRTVYAFQVADGVAQRKVQGLFECDAENRLYLAMGIDEAFMRKGAKEMDGKYPGVLDQIRFVSVKDMRTSMETSLRKEIFGDIKDPEKKIGLKKPGSLRDADVRAGLIITKLGKDRGYNTSNPEEHRFVWYLGDMKTKVLDVIVGKGFTFGNVRSLDKSAAKKKMYLTTKLYGEVFRSATDKLLRVFPSTMIEFMSIAEVSSTSELEKLLTNRIVADLKVGTEVRKLKKEEDPFAGW